MTVYIVVGSKGIIYGVFSSQRKALNYCYKHFGDMPGWAIYDRRIDEEV